MKTAFIGLPGCGKTTQAKKLAAHLGISYISMRSLVEDVVKPGDWQPLSDELAIQICTQAIANKSDFVLDGFPRTKEQYLGLKMPDIQIVWLDIPFAESRKRMWKRGDEKRAIARRMNVEKWRYPLLIETLKSDRIIRSYDATQPQDEVFAEILHHLTTPVENQWLKALFDGVESNDKV